MSNNVTSITVNYLRTLDSTRLIMKGDLAQDAAYLAAASVRNPVCYQRTGTGTGTDAHTCLISSVSGTLVYGSMALTLLRSSTG